MKFTKWTICAFHVMNPRQWSLAKQSSLNVENDGPKVPNQAGAKRDGVINPQNYNFYLIFIRKILMLSKRYESTEVDRRTWLHVPSGTHWSTSSDIHQVVEIQKRDFYSAVCIILNRIKFTKWTICTFRVMNPRQ